MYLRPSGWLFGATQPHMHWEKSCILQLQRRGYKSVDPSTKQQKAIPDNLVIHIYSKHHYHLITSIGQIITGDLLFGMISCEYYTTPKGENKKTCILRKGGIKFYREWHKIIHSSSRIHFSDKALLTYRKQKNGVKNKTATQCQTGKQLFSVRIWANIITRLGSYPGKSDDPPINTVWVKNSRTRIIPQMKTKTPRSGILSFRE